MDDSTKQALLGQFSAWLDTAGEGRELPEEPAPTTDLLSLLVELAGLRSEVRTESRLVKEALDQFRDVFTTLRDSQTGLQQEVERARNASRDNARAALRPLLLDVIDLRDRLVAALKFSKRPRRWWLGRLSGRKAGSQEAWREGLGLTLRRLDQVLLDQHVVALRLKGQPLDLRHACVVGIAANDDAPDGTVVEEVRACFLWNDQVLRTAEVIVAKSNTRTAGDKP